VKVLVTGATGFTGGHLARALKRRGHEVWAMVRPSTGAARTPASDLERDGIAIVAGDLASSESLAPALADKDFEVVYNIAALYRQAGLPECVYHEVNATAVGQLIDAAAGAGVRRVVH
jgi:dihydroflavonol-4-reductase